MHTSSHSDVIRAEDSAAVPKLQAKIAAAEQLQAMMKAANVIVRNRRLSDDEKVSQLVAECQISDGNARSLLRPDYAGRLGFPNYQLTNNSANIRRMQQRLKGLADESGRGSVTLEFNGGRVEDSAEACRVRIYHDAKPPEGTIAKLRSYGFHWTPSLGCWQRLRNESARYAASQITGVRWPEVAPALSTGPTVATANTASVSAIKTGVAA